MPRKKKRKKDTFDGKYTTLIRHGEELLNRYLGGGHTEKRGKFGKVHKHYSRESIQQALFEYAKGRKITTLRLFRPMFPNLRKPEDILPLAFNFADRGKLWPSFHGTISRSVEGKRVCDLVLEADFKSSWKVAFEATRPLIKFLEDFGIDFKIKFSGNSSPHVIVPAEAFPPGVSHTVHARLLDYANKYVKGKAHLDMSFRDANHFLRLAYSLNENTGRVSLPIDPDDFDDFHPGKADIENAKILKDWWTVSPDAPDRTVEMIRFIMERKAVFIPKRMKKVAAKQFQKMPTQLILAPGAQARAEVLKKLQMPYDQMLAIGQQIFQRRDELMERPNVQEAVATLKEIHQKSGVMSTHEVSTGFEVESSDLWFLWGMLLRQDIFDYYAREDAQEAMFLHSMDRRVRLGNEEVIVELADPGDVLPLAAYIHETQGGIDYPAFYCTNTKRDVTTDEIIGCDVAVRIDGKGDIEEADRMVRWAISLFREVGADFAIALHTQLLEPESNIQNPVSYVIIPSEATPGMPRNEQEFSTIISKMEKQFKKALPHAEGISVLTMDEYIPLFYSVNEISGLPNIPVRMDKLDTNLRIGSLDDVQVKQDWWDIPADASAEMAEILRNVGKP